MAGRPRKTTLIKDISETGTTEEKKVIKDIIEKAEIAPEPSNANSGIVRCDEGSWLNVRSAPSFSAPVIDKLNNGDKVDIYETKSGFGKISILEDKWVSLEFIV